MKKVPLLLLAICCLLAACGTSSKAPAVSSAPVVTEVFPAETDPSADPASEPAVTVSPLPSTVDLDHLDNCTIAVSLEEGGAYLDDEGAMQMKVTVYTYDLYDMVDIARLKVGDTIILRQQNVPVTSVEQDESGAVLINGQYWLFSEEDGTFSEAVENDMHNFYAVGEATIRVSPDFLCTDSSDLDTGEVTFYPGDFLVEHPGIVYPFSPNGTTLVIENGLAIAMNRVYTP